MKKSTWLSLKAFLIPPIKFANFKIACMDLNRLANSGFTSSTPLLLA